MDYSRSSPRVFTKVFHPLVQSILEIYIFTMFFIFFVVLALDYHESVYAPLNLKKFWLSICDCVLYKLSV